MQKHTIRRLIAETWVANPKDASNSQQQLSYWINAVAFRRQLEETLDELVSEEEYLQIDRLELHVEEQNEQKFRASFLRELKKAIRQLQVQQQIKSSSSTSVEQMSKHEAEQKMAIYFLTHGVMPWSVNQTTAEKIHHIIQNIPYSDDVVFLKNLLEAGRFNAAIWRRLIYCIGIKGVKIIFLQRLKFSAAFMEWVEQLESKNSTISVYTAISPEVTVQEKEKKILFWLSVLQLVSEGKTESFIMKLIASEIDSKLFKKAEFEKKPIRQRPVNSNHSEFTGEPVPVVKESLAAAKKEVMADGCFVHNAGLVLIWGELGRLFRSLGYVEGKAFRNAKVQQEAMILLHYLTTGELHVWEDELLLNKVLCGWAMDEPVDTTLVPDEQAQKAAEVLLLAFINEWMKGRKYSPHWLRHNFLRREGILKKTPEGSWQLKVERKTEDVLLDMLPPGFGLSVVKYTWVQNIIFVQW